LRPGLSFVVITMLALGIGATTAIFSLYHQILLKPLPVPEPDRLVNLAAPGPKPGGSINDVALSNRAAQFTYPMFRDLERDQTGFAGIAAYVDFLANLSFEDRPTSGRGYLVSGSYFDVLGLEPALGRFIGRDDEPRVGESLVAVLSYEFWQRGLGGDRGVVGKTVTVNGRSLEVIGVAPQGFRGPNVAVRTDVFVPLTLAPLVSGVTNPGLFEGQGSRQSYWIYLFARLAPGVTLDRAAAQLNTVYSGVLNDVEAAELNAAQLPAGTLEAFRARQIAFSPGAQGQSNLTEQAERPLTLLLGVTALVLLIVCVNIANLLLARGAARSGEMATRASLGASRGWLVRQLLTESVVLIAIGGVASLVVAAFLVQIIAGLIPVGITIGLAPELSSTAMLFAAGASLATVVVFGLAPAWRVSDANPAVVMNQHARGSGGRGAARFRAALTTAQIAFSMLLLVLAGLFTKSLMNVAELDLGLDVESIVSFSVTPRQNAYSPERLADYYDRLEEALGEQPGVLAVGSSALPLLGNFALRQPLSVQGFEAAPGAETTAAVTMVGADFFESLGIPLRTGRMFTERDDTASPMVAIVNESFARRFNLGTEVGRRAAFGTAPPTYPFEIVGIVEDAKQTDVKGDMEPVIYLSRYQTAGAIQAMFYFLRTAVDPESLLPVIPRVVAGIDPDVPVTNLMTMTTTVNGNVFVDRLLSMLSVGFAALATLLAGIGLYGVLAYNVAQRTRELGLRLALGAPPARLRTMVLKQVGVMALIGAAVGLAGALVFGQAAETQLFGLSARDPVVFGAAVAVLAAVVLAASWIPAWRASRIAPTEALRYQ
jgi:predicted permease